jgi:hypothetical protein
MNVNTDISIGVDAQKYTQNASKYFFAFSLPNSLPLMLLILLKKKSSQPLNLMTRIPRKNSVIIYKKRGKSIIARQGGFDYSTFSIL